MLFVVTVGMPVARHPPYRSRRALLTHRAPTSGADLQVKLPVVSVPALLASRAGEADWLCMAVAAFLRSESIQISPFSPLSRFSARCLFCQIGFPSVRPLSSTASAGRIRTCLCSAASWVLWACPTSHLCSSQSCSLRIHCADPATISSGPDMGSPGSRAESFRACMGSATARGRNTSCVNDVFRVAFRSS